MIQEAINKTREYIKYNYINTDVSRCRRYNIALNEIVKIEKGQYKELKNRILNLNNKILECISNHEDEFYYLDNFIEQIPMFYKYFDEYGIEFTEDMKVIQCILVYHMYALGEYIEDIDVDEMKNNDNKILHRTILFRGKVSEDDELGYKKGEWVKGSLFINDIEGETYIFDCGTNDKVKVDNNTVGQCTGYMQNNSFVFEGDIVQDKDNGDLGIVYWNEDKAGFEIEFCDETEPMEDIDFLDVIGNKLDNPELFKDYLESVKDYIESHDVKRLTK